MKLLLTIVILAYRSTGISGFLLDSDPLTTIATTLNTTAPDGCSIDVFSSCTDAIRSIIDVNGTGDVSIDTDALRDFYCGPNVTSAIQCLKDRVDPNCGPDTDAAFVSDSLARIPPDYSYDSVCANSTENNELLRCQSILPNVQGFIDCVTGETLNKTLDPTDTCNFFEATLGCSYKYTEIMCPSAMNAFRESAKYANGCPIDYENSQEARSCDEDMKEACDASYNPPSFDDAAGFVDFTCSGRSLKYQQCLNKVFDICKNVNGFNATTLNNNLENFKNQTDVICSGENSDLTKCTAMFPRLTGFQDCVTGVTLNKIVDPTDVCKYFQTAVGCSEKYTNLMCPGQLDALQKTTKLPPSCTESINGSPEATSCDGNMTKACEVAYKPPLGNETDVGESFFDFICSGRASGYVACLKKVNGMCSSSGIDVSALLNGAQINKKQTDLICSDKTGYVAFTNCLNKYVESEDFTDCMSNLTSSDICSTTIAAYKCNAIAIQKTCPSSAAFYKRYIYDTMKACNATSTLDILFNVTSSSNHPDLSIWALFTFVTYAVFLNLFV